MTTKPEGTRPRGATFSIAIRSATEVVQAMVGSRMAWALPLAFVLLLLAGVLGVLALFPALSPFVYPLL